MRGIVVIAASMMLAFGLAPTPAQAQVDYVWAYWKDPAKVNNGGNAQTNTSHKNLVVLDIYADGWGTRAQFQMLKWDTNGNR